MIELITNRALLTTLLNKLQEDTLPLWGKMNAQGMVEHLAELVETSNGKRKAVYEYEIGKMEALKQMAIYTDFQISLGANALQLSDKTIQLKCNNLNEAIGYLYQELDDFNKHYTSTEQEEMHPAWGPLTYHEWQVWHGKHFLHHFKQFGIL